MANYFVSSADGDNGDNGSTMDLAWATLEYGVESGGLSAGDFIFVRPNHSEIPTTDISLAYSGTAGSFINIIAWPKPAFSITSATWTNGSTTVDLVLPASLTHTGHIGRKVTAPDGYDYFITDVTDSNTFTIDREYAGATVTLTNGASTIIADEYYTEAQAIDDSAWTIKKSDWNANNPARPVIDFNDTSYGVYTYFINFILFQGLEIKDSSDGAGILQLQYSTGLVVRGCILAQGNDACLLNTSGNTLVITECIFEGDGVGGSQIGIYSARYSIGEGILIIRDSAIYNCGDHGIASCRPLYLDNVNIGVEAANGDDDIRSSSLVKGKNVKLGGSNGYLYLEASYGWDLSSIENYQKILGDHRTFFPGGYYEKAAVSGETPNKKVSDDVLKITPNVSGYEFIPEMAVCVLEHEIEMTAAAHTLKYWVYNDSGVTLNDVAATDNIWLEAEYVVGFDDTSEYIQTKLLSTQIDILDAADADDWDYLEVTLTPATASKVRLKIYFSKYLAATNVFIDPAVVIT